MPNLMGKDGRQLTLAFGDTDYPGIDHHEPSRKRLSVDFRIVENVEGENLLAAAAPRQILS